jgi:hypothetical protein
MTSSPPTSGDVNLDGWTLGTLRIYLDRVVGDLRSLLDERYQTQTKALDAAFDAAEKAVQTALLAAEKAVGKAETAADKRFDAVNEFRQQLNDQTQTFITRLEAEAATTRNTERIQELTARVNEMSTRTSTKEEARIDGRVQRDENRLNLNALLTFLGLAVVAAGLVINAVH